MAFPSHFAEFWLCSTCLLDTTLIRCILKTFHLENSLKSQFNINGSLAVFKEKSLFLASCALITLHGALKDVIDVFMGVNICDVISDTQQLLYANWHKNGLRNVIGDKTNLQIVKIKSRIFTVRNSEITTFYFIEKSPDSTGKHIRTKQRTKWRQIWGHTDLIDVGLYWCLTSPSTIFKSFWTEPPLPGYIASTFGAQGHNTADVGFEPPTSRSGVWSSTSRPLRSSDLKGMT